MSETILVGRGRRIEKISREHWEDDLPLLTGHNSRRLDFMTEGHHQIRRFVVSELPRVGRPISPELIAAALKLPPSEAVEILDSLESHLFFLNRNDAGEVSWAYPITVEETPHRLTFENGDQLYAACGEDSIAAAYVLGRLRKEPLSLSLETSCGHCGQPMRIDVSSELAITSHNEGSEPLIFIPDIDWDHFQDPTLVHAF